MNELSRTTSKDVFGFEEIYNDKFSYCVQESVIKQFCGGKAFDHKESYSEDEIARIAKDYLSIKKEAMSGTLLKEKIARITCGAPGAGKTWLLRKYFNHHVKKFCYIDPDDVCLRKMKNTYQKEIYENIALIDATNNKDRISQEKKIRLDAYNKWRPASNGLAHVNLAHIIKNNFAFYFGSTSSSVHTKNTFKWLKERGYYIHLIHVIAKDDLRWKSIELRDKEFVQTTEKDVKEKGLLVPQRINDTYLAFADSIAFWYRTELETLPSLTAIWLRDSDKSGHLGKLTIYNQKMYDEMKSVHNEICNRLDIEDKNDLFFENSIEKKSLIETQSLTDSVLESF